MKTEIGTDIEKAKFILEHDGLVAIPTETVYGLAANALKPNSVAKIFEAKQRPHFDPLIIHISKITELYKYTSQLDEELCEIASKYWPGPLTILLPKNELIPDIVTAGLDKVAVRIPDHPLTLDLLSRLEFPLAAPSANPFNYVSPTAAAHVYDQLQGKVNYILDGGSSKVGVESTIIGKEDSQLVMYRKGGLELEFLEKNYSIRVNTMSESNPAAPGMLKKHYAPDKEIRLLDSSIDFGQLDKTKTGFLRFNSPVIGFAHQFILSEKGDLAEAAYRLFEGLRYLDKLPISIIYIEFVPETGLGRAINDRLKRTLG